MKQCLKELLDDDTLPAVVFIIAVILAIIMGIVYPSEFISDRERCYAPLVCD